MTPEASRDFHHHSPDGSDLSGYHGFLDDAAIFPPGLASIERAVEEHLARRESPAGPFLGPLVIPAHALTDVVRLAGDSALEVSLVGAAEQVGSALHSHLADGAVTIVAVELTDAAGTIAAATTGIGSGVQVYVELTAADVAAGALDRCVAAGARAKFRTGGLTAQLYPSATDLARLVEAAVTAAVPFKLTAGLHRALRYTNASTGITHHGFLNLAAATYRAMHGAPHERIVEAILARELTDLPEIEQTHEWRRMLVSFGTCSVSEPLASLARLDLLDPAIAQTSLELTMPVQNTSSAAGTYATAGFGIENLPYGSYRLPAGQARLGVRLGSQVLDAGLLAQCAGRQDLAPVLDTHNLDALLAAGRGRWDQVRSFLQTFLSSAQSGSLPAGCVNTVEAVEMLLPFTPVDYVDFYASEHHATNVGRIFRPDQAPLTPNWHHLPIGYHGRASTLVVSGTDVARPKGLLPTGPGRPPQFGECRRLDIEAEVGFVVGGSAPSGEVAMTQAEDFIFGLTLVNDWSARDIQAFEYVPLGPFLGKSFATSIGAWVVPLAALEAARASTPERVSPLAEYLDDSAMPAWNFDVSLEIDIDSQVISRPPFARMYFSAAQMLAHLSVNGASVNPGDFFASGTVSGPLKEQRGSLLELTWGGTEPLELADGKEMTFLEDGQTVTITATAPGPDGSVIDFGSVTGRIIPATAAR